MFWWVCCHSSQVKQTDPEREKSQTLKSSLEKYVLWISEAPTEGFLLHIKWLFKFQNPGWIPTPYTFCTITPCTLNNAQTSKYHHLHLQCLHGSLVDILWPTSQNAWYGATKHIYSIRNFYDFGKLWTFPIAPARKYTTYDDGMPTERYGWLRLLQQATCHEFTINCENVDCKCMLS